MIRFLAATVLLAVVIAASVWVADRPGRVVLDVPGYRVETTVAVALLMMAALIVAVGFIYRAWRWLRRGPAQLAAKRAAERERRGYLALVHGMAAVVAGDAREATRQASRADALLEEPPLGRLLAAEAARLAGDPVAARRHFSAMLAAPETEHLGLRGLAGDAHRAGDDIAALAYARRARVLRPGAAWPLGALFDLEARAGNWRAAEEALAPAVKAGALQPAAARRRRTLARYARAKAAADAGQTREALNHAGEAHRLERAFVPAAVLLARLAAGAKQPRQAESAILATWALAPHPDLAAAFHDLRAGEDAGRRRRHYAKLDAANHGHRETRIALAEAALAAEDWTDARAHLEPVMRDEPEARLCLLMTRIEVGENGTGAGAEAWRRRADGAPAPAWTCAGCGWSGAEWRHFCPTCDAFDQLAWRAPAEAGGAEPVGVIEAAARPALAPPGETLPAPSDGGAVVQGRSVSVSSRNS